jgi:hypothetical protein
VSGFVRRYFSASMTKPASLPMAAGLKTGVSNSEAGTHGPCSVSRCPGMISTLGHVVTICLGAGVRLTGRCAWPRWWLLTTRTKAVRVEPNADMLGTRETKVLTMSAEATTLYEDARIPKARLHGIGWSV